MNLLNLKPCYSNSHALVIGINKYLLASPLGYAINDAKAIAKILVEKLEFPSGNVRLLTGEDATRSAIMQTFLAFACPEISVDDRLLVFFAGHGHTVSSYKGEVGYLVPYDGDHQNLSTLIRWDELTRNADLINAKHILFLMDACYGGLAIKRALKPGSMRFIKDMLLRPARQVLTAGKADELVSDLGGPLPDHSVFTGHLLEALSGKAGDSNGLLTANGVMAYVYNEVANDPESEQTPHFGFLDGDGDLIFSGFKFLEVPEAQEIDKDILVSIPAVLSNEGEIMTVIDQTKELLSEEKYRIKLHDLVTMKTREMMSVTTEDSFPVQTIWNDEEFLERINKYEKTTTDLRGIQALLGFWGSEAHRITLVLPVKQMGGRIEDGSGTIAWLALRWYPMLLLMYCGGIAAVAAGNYDNLRALMQANVSDPERALKSVTLVRNVGKAKSDLKSAFNILPGHSNQHVPHSEYLFKFLQPELDDILCLGMDYERYFDEFEVLFALEFAEEYDSENGHVWGPPGRFAWKYDRGDQSSPFHRVLRLAQEQGEYWPPIKAGLFSGDINRFEVIAKEYSKPLAQLGWH